MRDPRDVYADFGDLEKLQLPCSMEASDTAILLFSRSPGQPYCCASNSFECFELQILSKFAKAKCQRHSQLLLFTRYSQEALCGIRGSRHNHFAQMSYSVNSLKGGGYVGDQV